MMVKGQNITIYQDGKLCRGVQAKILEVRSKGFRLLFDCSGEEVIAWSRRRNTNRCL